MNDFIEELTQLSARLRRDLTLVELSQEWERESWMDKDDIERSETLRILDLYRDRTESALASLDYQIRRLLEHCSSNARNP